MSFDNWRKFSDAGHPKYANYEDLLLDLTEEFISGNSISCRKIDSSPGESKTYDYPGEAAYVTYKISFEIDYVKETNKLLGGHKIDSELIKEIVEEELEESAIIQIEECSDDMLDDYAGPSQNWVDKWGDGPSFYREFDNYNFKITGNTVQISFELTYVAE